ncbi:MAG: Hint domain-containing protein [Paludibacteraceae bacterium]|nr:Hint domain-containing protein [Paludibacteraceae bacterium]
MLKKYYLSSNPLSFPREHDVEYLNSIDDLIEIKEALIYCDSEDVVKNIRKYDDKGMLHLGCRGANVSLLCQAPVLRFGEGNYLICSKSWNDVKFSDFLNFKPKEPLKLPETHYLNISELTDDEAARIFSEQMQTICSAPALGIDFETNGFPEEDTFFPLGLSICDTENSYYYDFEDYLGNKDKYEKFYDALRVFVRDNAYKLYAFNVSFEIRCFYFMYHQFFKLQDTRAWCIIDNMKSNLKYCAQYYLEVASWDDSVDEEMRALQESFELPIDEFKYEYSLGANSQYPYVRSLVEYNKDNPNFIPRYEKYHGSTWATANQKTVGKYCCYDSVMDVHIYNVIKNYKHVDHYYSDECYQVYLFNQYLATIIELSGIFIDPKLLEEQRDTFQRIEFNTDIWLNKEMVKFKIHDLKKHIGDRIQVKLNDKLIYLVDELGSYMFITSDRVKLGKEFVKLVRGKPDLFDKLVTKYGDELYYVVDSWEDEEEFKKILRQRKVFQEIGEKLFDEWDLGNIFHDFNEQYIKRTDCNRLALDNLTFTEEELRELLAKGEKKWKAVITDAPSQYYAKRFIADLNEIHDEKEFERSLELRKYEAMYERMVPCFKGKTIYDPIDEKLSWMKIFEFNAPTVKDLTGTLLQGYCQDSYALFAGFTELTKKQPKIPYTEAVFKQYCTQMGKKDLKHMEEFYDFYYEKVPQFMDKVVKDWKTGGEKTISVRKPEDADMEQMWSVKNPPQMAKIFPPYSIPMEHQINPWIPRDQVDTYTLDDEFEYPVFEMHKFIGMYKLNRVIMKMMSTSEATIDMDSRNVTLMDHSRGLRHNGPLDYDKLIKYYVKIHQNMAKSGRWMCLTGDTLVKMSSGEYREIQNLYNHIGESVVSYNIETGLFEDKPLLKWKLSHTKAVVYKITFDDGTSVKCTSNHRWLVGDRYVSIEDGLCVGSLLQGLQITDISLQDSTEPVFDVEIEDNHNFMIGNPSLISFRLGGELIALETDALINTEEHGWITAVDLQSSDHVLGWKSQSNLSHGYLCLEKDKQCSCIQHISRPSVISHNSNVHSVFPPSEDTRVILQTKMGDHFLLRRKDDQLCDSNIVYRIDGHNFRASDEVKLSDGTMKLVQNLVEADEFDQDWLNEMIKQDQERTGNINWKFADICYSQNK